MVERRQISEAERIREVALRMLLSRTAPISMCLLGLMILAYIGAFLLGGTADSAVLARMGAKVNERLAEGQVWRLLASVFLHVGLFHLVVNGYAMHIVGRLVENSLGPARFLILFTSAGVMGTVASYLASPIPSAGASGAIFGLLGAAIATGYKYRRQIPFMLRWQLAWALIPWLIIALIFGFIYPKIDNAAHLGGLVTCTAMGWTFKAPMLMPDPPAEDSTPIRIATIGAIAAILLTVMHSIWNIFEFG